MNFFGQGQVFVLGVHFSLSGHWWYAFTQCLPDAIGPMSVAHQPGVRHLVPSTQRQSY